MPLLTRALWQTLCQQLLCANLLTAKIEAVQLEMGVMRQDMDKLLSRVTKTEQWVGFMEDTVTEHSSALRTLQTKMKDLENKADNAENHHVGLAEGVEGTNPRCLWRTCCVPCYRMLTFLPITLLKEHIGFPPRPGPLGSLPCTLILRLLNFRDRDEVLRGY